MAFRRLLLVFATAAVVLLGAFTVHASPIGEINFDDLTGGLNPPPPLPADFTPLATFSTEAGASLVVFGGAGVVGVSPPNSVTATFGASTGTFSADVYVDFTDPVDNLQFNVASDNDAGEIATVNVYQMGALSLSLPVVGNADFSDPIPIDLTGYTDITRVEIVDVIDEFGLSYDDFTFYPVPEPSALLLMLIATIATVCVSNAKLRSK